MEQYPTQDYINEQYSEYAAAAPRVEGDPWIWGHAMTYIEMAAEGKFRPCAPSDGCGNIQLGDEEFEGRAQLLREAMLFGIRWSAIEHDARAIDFGCVNGDTGAASVLAIEAGRVLCGGAGTEDTAIKLLRMAIDRIENRKLNLSVDSATKERWISRALGHAASEDD